MFDPCGRAGGGAYPGAPGSHAEFTNTTFATFGDLGSKVLPRYPTGTVWAAGSIVETLQSIRSNHGGTQAACPSQVPHAPSRMSHACPGTAGGYQYRLCPLSADLTEACFQSNPMPFADDSSLMMSNGTMLKLNSTFVSEGTLPLGSAWQMLGIPDTNHVVPNGPHVPGWAFPPPCYEPRYPDEPFTGLDQGRCSGQWIHNITLYDQLRVPEHLEPGDYVLGLRWDCETSAQVWQSCADVTITAPKKEV